MSHLVAQMQALADALKAKRAAQQAISKAQQAPAAPAPVVTPADALKARMSAIEAQCHGWKSCRDGSYEMALHSSGYYKLQDQLEALEGAAA